METHVLGLSSKKFFLPEYRPDIRLVSAEKLSFKKGERPGLITLIESLQYFPDKLRVFVHLYNQLADNGVLVVASENRAFEWIRSRDHFILGRDPIVDDMIAPIVAEGIELVALMSYRRWGHISDARMFAIRRKPGTRLVAQTRLHNIWTNPHGYSASYYELSHTGRAPIKVVTDSLQ